MQISQIHHTVLAFYGSFKECLCGKLNNFFSAMLGGGWGTAYIVWGICQQLFIPKTTFIDIMTFSRQAKWTKFGQQGVGEGSNFDCPETNFILF